MKTGFKKFLLFAILIIVIAFCAFQFVINKPHPDYENVTASFSLSANDLFEQYTASRKASEVKYNGKVIEISGRLKKIERNDTIAVIVFSFREGIFGDEGIRCTLLPKFIAQTSAIANNSEIKIKGFCSGYNDTDVIFTKCSIVK